jgi:hypothetical protein
VILESIEVILGIMLVGLSLRDVFDTVVVPGESRGSLRVARRLLSTMLPIWKMIRRGKPAFRQVSRPPFSWFLRRLDGGAVEYRAAASAFGRLRRRPAGR